MKRLPSVILFIRLLLGIVFVTYGVVKLCGGQYYYGDFTLDSKTVSGTFFVWAFFGWSKVYALFTGCGELLAGVLLLIPRTRTAGAVALFPVTLNITVMTFAFGFPGVKYASLLYTLLCAVLLLYDWPKLKLIFLTDAKTEALLRTLQPTALAEPPATLQAVPRGKLSKRLAVAAALLPLGFFLLNAAVASLTPGPEAKAKDACAAQGWRKDDLVLKRSHYAGSGTGFNRQGFVLFEVKGATPPKLLRVEVNRPHSFVAWQIGNIAEEASTP